jgi:hypothetical protein
MSLSPNARRADAFARLLESGGRTDDPTVGPFVALAEALSAVPAVAGPRPEFRTALRQRLVAVATVQGVDAPAVSAADRLREAGATWKVQRRMAVLAGGAAAVTAIAGVGLGASRSLPGDPFYGVKRATEDVQLATTFGQEAKGHRHLQFARTRLSEVQALTGQTDALADVIPGKPGALGALVDEASSDTIIATLEDMDEETRAGANDLFAVYRDTASRDPLEALDEFTQVQYAELSGVLPSLPPEAHRQALGSLALLSTVAKQTVRLAGTAPESDGSSSKTPGDGDGKGNGGSAKPHKTATPSTDGETSSSPGTSTNGGSTPTPAPVPTEVPTRLPTDAPTIPPVLPTEIPTLPTELPTSLPDVPDLPLLGG